MGLGAATAGSAVEGASQAETLRQNGRRDSGASVTRARGLRQRGPTGDDQTARTSISTLFLPAPLAR